MIFIDTNVLVDATRIGTWTEWSQTMLLRGRAGDVLVTSHVVLAEFAARFATLQEELALLAGFGVAVVSMTDDDAYRAGRAHAAYRRAGGERGAVLADFLIGGHAESLGATLLTRDRQRFATYFPTLTLITPETHP